MTHSTATLTTFTSVQIPTTMGLDLSDRVSEFLVLRGDDHKLEAGRICMTREPLSEVFTGTVSDGMRRPASTRGREAPQW